MNKIDTKALRSLDAKRTPGEWVSPWDQPDDEDPNSPNNAISTADGKRVVWASEWDGPNLAVVKQDAAVLVAAVNSLSALCDAADERDALRNQRASLMAVVEAARRARDAPPGEEWAIEWASLCNALIALDLLKGEAQR